MALVMHRSICSVPNPSSLGVQLRYGIRMCNILRNGTSPSKLSHAITSSSRPICFWSFSSPAKRQRLEKRVIERMTWRDSRIRSCWGGSRSLWWPYGRHRRSLGSWHKPDCKWVRSTGDPKVIPRDKECSGCMEEERMPYEWSRRELIWHRHREQMREALEKYPYETLFGASNRFINELWGSKVEKMQDGLWKDAMINLRNGESSLFGSRILSEEPRQSGEKIPSQQADNADSSNSPVNKKPMSRDYSDASKSPTNAKSDTHADLLRQTRNDIVSHSLRVSGSCHTTSNSNSRSDIHAKEPSIEAHVAWQTSSIDSSGKKFQDSGKFVFDPISMKMVPASPSQNEGDAARSVIVKDDKENTRRVVPFKQSPPLQTAEKPNLSVEMSQSHPPRSQLTVPSANLSEDYEAARGQSHSQTRNRDDDFREQTWMKAKAALERSWNMEKQARSTTPNVGPEGSQGSHPNITQRLCSAQTRMSRKWARDSEYWKNPTPAKQQIWNNYLKAEAQALATDPTIAPSKHGLPNKNLMHDPLHSQALQVMRDLFPADVEALPAYIKWHLPETQQRVLSKPDAKEGNAKAGETKITAPLEKDTREKYPAYKEMFSALRSILVKDKPLKFMTSGEVRQHRQTLIKRMRSRNPHPDVKSPEVKRLEKEIEALKSMMDAIENGRYNKKQESNSAQSSMPAKNVMSLEESNIIAGEGDMCANVVNFINDGRWYKKSNEQRQRDKNLVKDVREAYESIYGEINTTHRQGQPILKPPNSEDHPRVSTETIVGTVQQTPHVFSKETATSSIQSTSSQPQATSTEIWYNVFEYDPQSGFVRSWSELSNDRAEPRHLSTQEALNKLHEPGKFLGRLFKASRLDEPICFAEGNVLKTRTTPEARFLPKVKSCREGAVPTHESSADRHGVNRPAKHVSYTTHSPRHKHKNPRRVRRQESVYSGMKPEQRDRIDDVIKANQAAASASGAKPGSQDKPNHSRKNGFDRLSRGKGSSSHFLKRGFFFVTFFWIPLYGSVYLYGKLKESSSQPSSNQVSEVKDALDHTIDKEEIDLPTQSSFLHSQPKTMDRTYISIEEEPHLEDPAQAWDITDFTYIEFPLLGSLGLYAWYLLFSR